MSEFGGDEPAVLRDARRPRRWPAFLAGLLLGLGVALGVLLAAWHRPALIAGHGHGDHADGHGTPVEVSHHPTDEEVLDYLDGKTLSLPTKDVNEKPRTVILKKAKITDLKWTGAGQISGIENPWNHTYSCLHADEGGAYILDLRIPVRVVGSRRVFLPLESSKVTPVDKVFTPKKK